MSAKRKKKVVLSRRKFHKTVFEMVVLSEDEIPDGLGPAGIAEEMTTGAYSGFFRQVSHKVMGAKETARELRKQGSEPMFFRLTRKGEEQDGEAE